MWFPMWSRLLAAEIWKNGEPQFYSKRREVERYFGQLSPFAGALAPPPAWVRNLERVRRWVAPRITNVSPHDGFMRILLKPWATHLSFDDLRSTNLLDETASRRVSCLEDNS